VRRHYYITGVDGIGKTTQVNRLERRLANERTHRVWLRFPFVISLPLLVYARFFGFTRYEVFDGVRVGAWEFHRSALLRTLFPITQYLDTVLLSIGKVWVPLLLGRTMLFERYALDVMVDMMVATGRPALHRGLLGYLFTRLIPRHTVVVILDAPVKQLRSRRPDLKHDRLMEARAQAYAVISRHLDCTVIRADATIADIEIAVSNLVTQA